MGPATFALAHQIVSNQVGPELPQLARPVLERLASDTGETVILAALSDSRREMVYVDVIIADSPLQYAVPSGDRRPLYSSASGKSVLAFLSDEEQDRYIGEAEFRAVTPFTTRRDNIRSILEQVRQSCVIHDKDGHFVGAGAIASPIFNADGQAFASIGVAAPNERLDRIADRAENLLRSAAAEISGLIGYDGPYPPLSGAADHSATISASRRSSRKDRLPSRTLPDAIARNSP